MSLRSSDTGPGALDSHGSVKITREIPLWGILSVLGALAAQAVGLYYSNQSLAKAVEQQSMQLTAVAGDVRAINAEINRGNIRSVEFTMNMEDVKRRLQALEDRSSKR